MSVVFTGKDPNDLKHSEYLQIPVQELKEECRYLRRTSTPYKDSEVPDDAHIHEFEVAFKARVVALPDHDAGFVEKGPA